MDTTGVRRIQPAGGEEDGSTDVEEEGGEGIGRGGPPPAVVSDNPRGFGVLAQTQEED